MSEIARPNVRRMQPYQPGKPVEEVQRELGLSHVVKLASNENPLGPSPRAVQAVTAAMGRIHLYPDGAMYTLRGALATHYRLPGDRFAFGNGSDELIHYLGVAYLDAGDEMVIGHPSFVRYDAAAELANAHLVRVPLTHDLRHDLPAMSEAITPRTKLVFIANPNNPTGTIVTRDEWHRFLGGVPDHVLVVMDEAYFEYVDSPAFPDVLAAIESRNVVVLRTFSKAFGLAGLRVGYAIGRPELLDALERVREPFNVNALAQAAAAAAIGDREHLCRTRELNVAGRQTLYDAFTRLGLRYIETEANFVLFDCARDGREVASALLHLGVIVRPCAGFGLPDYVRVSVGTAEENRLFVEALAKVLAA